MSKILGSAYNNARNTIASVLGPPDPAIMDLGYNLTVTSVSVDPYKEKVFGDHLNKVIADVNTVLTHQTNSGTPLTTHPRGQKVTQAHITGVAAYTDTAFNNRNTAGSRAYSSIVSDSYGDSTAWRAQRSHKLKLDWGSNAEFRGWANLGGFIRLGATISGGSSNAQVVSWTNLLANSGVLVFSNAAAVQQGQSRPGLFPNGGLYNILSNGQAGVNAGKAYTITTPDLHYTTNTYVVYISPLNGSNSFDCTGFVINIELLDPHVPLGASQDDLIDGLFSVTVETYYSFNKKPVATILENKADNAVI
jgi:hypothetical protein